MDKSILRALYYLRKNQIVLAFRMDAEKSMIPASQAYAWSNGCFPYFHADEDAEIYAEFFSASKDLVTNVIEFLDSEWLADKFHTFYQLEDHFGRDLRVELIKILRYCYLDDRFGQKSLFWETLKKSCPCEALSIDSPLDEWEI